MLKILYRRCPQCSCVFGCLQQNEETILKEKICWECSDNNDCVVYKTEDFDKFLLENAKIMVHTDICNHCNYDKKKSMSN